MLHIRDTLVVRTDDGPPDAEYALFEIASIELYAPEPGMNREIGYRTTAGDARSRLAVLGITSAVAEEIGGALFGTLANEYALGDLVRKVTPRLAAFEMLESHAYLSETRAYEGAWLDLAALTHDMKVPGAAATLHALFLSLLLSEVDENAQVFLDTQKYASARRPGERTYKRPSFDVAATLVGLRDLASAGRPSFSDRHRHPATRDQIMSLVKGHLALDPPDKVRGRLVSIESTVAAREAPTRGPLADPELWAIEEQISRGDPMGAIHRIDALEHARGRVPATTYLRARACLIGKTESPKAIAERISALAQSMTAFWELELLAAHAWLASGDEGRARAFSRDLVDNPSAPDDLRIQGLELLEQIAKHAPRTPPPQPAPSAPVSRDSLSMVATSKPSLPRVSASPASMATTLPEDEELEAAPDTQIDPVPIVSLNSAPPGPVIEDATVRERIPNAIFKPSAESNKSFGSTRPMSTRPRQVTAQHTRPAAIDAPILDVYGEAVRESIPVVAHTTRQGSDWPPAQRSFPPAASPAVPVDRAAPTRPPRPLKDSDPTLASPSAGQIAAAHDASPNLSGGGIRVAPSPQGGNLVAPPVTSALATTAQSPQNPALALARGGSQPPFRSDVPPPAVPLPPPAPRNQKGARTEKAEALTLPPGLHGQPARDETPRTPIEARVNFTHLSRELGKDYRTKLKIELKTDVASIEAMQRHLREHFVDGQIRNADDAFELRRHGAFLSEVLARTLGAYWVDIGPSELGYWAMLVPSASSIHEGTRVWPFGRILRFVAMGHKERDLVSYYLELCARASR